MTQAVDTDIFGNGIRFWRKKRGRSQLDLSLIAGYSQRHISFLESGRAKPSREAIVALADALQVPLRERNRLLLAAGFAPLYSDEPLTSTQLGPTFETMRELLAMHRPFPAILVDQMWNVFAVNENAAALFSLFGNSALSLPSEQKSEPLNAIRLCLDKNGMRPQISNWTEFLRAMSRQLRQLVDSGASPTALTGLIDDIDLALRQSGATQIGPSEPKTPAVPLNLRHSIGCVDLISLSSQFNFPLDATLAELRIETFLPANPQSRQFLIELDGRLPVPAAPTHA